MTAGRRKFRRRSCWSKLLRRRNCSVRMCLLRPVVQDYLLPTLAYTGGAAETAYFAQVGAVYDVADRPGNADRAAVFGNDGRAEDSAADGTSRSYDS